MSEELKAFRELSKLKPPDPEKNHYTAFTYRMGIMVGELINDGKITVDEGKAIAAELSNMDGTVKALMERIWPHELDSNPKEND